MSEENRAPCGWVAPPDKPPLIDDGDAKTSAVFVVCCIAVVLAVVAISVLIRLGRLP